MAKKRSATNGQSFRTFLLMQQFAASEIGERIAQARRENDAMTQEQLAELLDVSTRAVQNYEAGITIPWKHFSRLEHIFKKDLTWFLHGESPTSDEGDDRLDELVRKVDLLLDVVGRLLALQAGVEAGEAEELAARVVAIGRSRQERVTG